MDKYDLNRMVEEEALSFMSEMEEYIRDGVEAGWTWHDLQYHRPNLHDYFHEQVIDKYWDLDDAVCIIQYVDPIYIEEDSGLWDGVEPLQALPIQAAFTFGNVVSSRCNEIYDEIVERYEDLVEEYGDFVEMAIREIL